MASNVRRQHGEAGRALLPALAQDAQPRIRHDAQHVFATFRHQVVAAITEEGKVAVRSPVQEGLDLGHLRPVDGGGIDLGADFAHAGQHLRPVLHCLAHVLQYLVDTGPQSLQLLRVGLPVDISPFK